jgi:hypothetical protein
MGGPIEMCRYNKSIFYSEYKIYVFLEIEDLSLLGYAVLLVC